MAKTEKPNAKKLGDYLLERYQRWKDIYENGCSDPTWEDGANIDLVRNHILITKKNLEECLGDNFLAYPDLYFFPEPVKLPHDFMAVERLTGIPRRLLPATKTLPYEEVVKFDWSEALAPC